MPYIKKNQRSFLTAGGGVPMDVGELTWAIQDALRKYLLNCSAGSLGFSELAECIAALEAAKLDFYERIVRPYEESKRRDNGDVWDASLFIRLGL